MPKRKRDELVVEGERVSSSGSCSSETLSSVCEDGEATQDSKKICKIKFDPTVEVTRLSVDEINALAQSPVPNWDTTGTVRSDLAKLLGKDNSEQVRDKSRSQAREDQADDDENSAINLQHLSSSSYSTRPLKGILTKTKSPAQHSPTATVAETVDCPTRSSILDRSSFESFVESLSDKEIENDSVFESGESPVLEPLQECIPDSLATKAAMHHCGSGDTASDDNNEGEVLRVFITIYTKVNICDIKFMWETYSLRMGFTMSVRIQSHRLTRSNFILWMTLPMSIAA